PASALPPSPSRAGLRRSPAGLGLGVAAHSLLDLRRDVERDLAGLSGLPSLLGHVAHHHPTAGGLARPDVLERRLIARAAVDLEHAARMELAAGGHAHEVRRQAS